jgi:hypothetical protein
VPGWDHWSRAKKGNSRIWGPLAHLAFPVEPYDSRLRPSIGGITPERNKAGPPIEGATICFEFR